MIHIVKFEFVKEIRQIVFRNVDERSLLKSLKDGFWLDSESNLCEDDADKTFYIPAHRIYMVIRQ